MSVTLLEDEILQKLMEKNIFSEYLPKAFCMDNKKLDVFNAGGSYKDYIEPYSYTMSRLGQKGDRRTISIPDASAYVSVLNYLRDNKSILKYIANLSIDDINSFSRVVNSDSTLIDDDEGYGNIIHPLGVFDSGDKSEEEEKKRSIFIDNMLIKIDRTKGACGILHVDISEFYRSIYTHAITTIKLGVEGAREAYNNISTDNDYLTYCTLDKVIRSLNGKRTNGLLVGPYISKVISEAILARVDEDLRNKNLVFTRYADDYEFAVYNRDEIDSIKEDIFGIFGRYFFVINNEKTKFEEYPFYVFSNFEHALGMTDNEKKDIEVIELFNKFWELEKNGEKGAIRYLLKAYQDKYKVEDETVYCNYLINVLCNDEKALALSCEILIREYEKERITIGESTKAILLKKLNQEVKNKHEWEAIWLVYLMKHIDCNIPDKLQNELWESGFELLKVMWIHEYSVDIGKIKDCFEKSKSWILLYELAVKIGNIDCFLDKLKVKNSRNFYIKLFNSGFSFYKKRSNEFEK